MGNYIIHTSLNSFFAMLRLDMLKLRMWLRKKWTTWTDVVSSLSQKRSRMNLFFDRLPTEIQGYIYTYDNTYRDKFDNVITQLNYKHDVASACGYHFPKQSLEGLLQRLFKSLHRKENPCNCYFCRSCCCYDDLA